MPSVGISDDGTKVVNDGGLSKLSISHTRTCLTLLAVMKELGLEQVLDLVRHSIRGIV
jgi:hypothetical protein